jgi:hypothetical protein
MRADTALGRRRHHEPSPDIDHKQWYVRRVDMPLPSISPARRWVPLAALLFGTLLTLTAGWWLKSPCVHPWPDGTQPLSCYNDIQLLWDGRGLSTHMFPYVHGNVIVSRLGANVIGVHLPAGELEYPALTGLFAWLTGLGAHNHASFLIISALALTPFAFVTTWSLWRTAGARAWWFAASPLLIWYAFLNWDLLPVAAVAAGVWAWRSGRHTWAAIGFSAGACAKLWPGFLLVPLLIGLLTERRFREAAKAATAAVALAIVVNVPLAVASPSGWWGPLYFQSYRLNDVSTNSLWFFFGSHLSVHTLNAFSLGYVLVAWIGVIAYGLRRVRAGHAFPGLQVGAALVIAYLVLGRVDSPQYALWLLPLLAVLAIRPGWQLALIAANTLLFAQWAWFTRSFDGVLLATSVQVVVLTGLAIAVLRCGEAPQPRRCGPQQLAEVPALV